MQRWRDAVETVKSMSAETRVQTFLTTNMIRYGWKELAKRAGIEEFLADIELHGIPIRYGVSNEISFEQAGIIVESSSADAFTSILNAEEDKLTWVSVSSLMPKNAIYDDDAKVPILFWGEGTEPNDSNCIKRKDDGTVIICIDMIAATVFMLSRWEEIGATEIDAYGRFPSSASVAYKQGFLDRPIIDEYAQILRAWVQELAPNWQPKHHTFSVKLSHDIDWVAPYPSWSHGLRHLAGDVIKRRDLGQAWATQRTLLSSVMQPDCTPQMQGVYRLAEYSKQAGLSSAFNFMATDHSSFDSGYDPAAASVRNCVSFLTDSGHEIGFHPSYYTLNNLSKLQAEKAKLESALTLYSGAKIEGGRQHYLRFQMPGTWRHWSQIEMSYDSTLGYADREGFRCGTCHPFTVFDFEQDQELPLVEIPLIVMEVALRSYRGMTIDEAHQRIIQLAKICRSVGGTFTLLWHNTSFEGVWSAWGERYPLIVQELAALA